MLNLSPHYVDKPWGRRDIPPIFTPPAGQKTGEVWFEPDDGDHLPLLVKYIFTSERLSIQVHPDDAQARAAGLAVGKSECWYILDCAPDAVLGIGLTRPVGADEFVAAAQDGSIERLIDWKPVRPGDFYYIPAGTVHAIGAGIALAEIQQNADVTYRLYDYGRPRELHLEQGRKVSRLVAYDRPCIHAPRGASRLLLGPNEAPFTVDLVHWGAGQALYLPVKKPSWFVPLRGGGTIRGQAFAPGQCWLLDDGDDIHTTSDGDALIACVA
jgi:mannose-6-phosphate isomerase